MKRICNVCGGKGGWNKKKQKDYPTEDLWMVCPKCDNYGWYEYDGAVEIDAYPNFDTYKEVITTKLTRWGNVVGFFKEEDEELDFTILFVPKLSTFTNLVKTMLKVSFHSDTLSIIPKQVFFFGKDEAPHYFWEITIRANSFRDFDCFIDVLDAGKYIKK